MVQQRLIEKTLIQQRFSKAADTYDATAVLYQEIGQRLVERLQWMRLTPRTVLDLGCGTGYITSQLLPLYPKAEYHLLDLSSAMLAKTQQKSLSVDVQIIQADAENLPYANQIFDLVIANQLLPWCDVTKVLTEVRRVLRLGGVFLFATLGPYALIELREAWYKADPNHVHVTPFFDMHDLGDALLQSGFSDPVMEQEYFTLQYSRVEYLIDDLRQLGEMSLLAERRRGLLGKDCWHKMLQNYETFRKNNQLPASYEVIYGHAWVVDVAQNKTKDPRVAYIPISAIKR